MTNGKGMFEELATKLDEAVPQLIEAKLTSVKSALDELKATEGVMKEYLQELSAQRPEEGKLVFAQFHAMREEVNAVKAMQQQQASSTAGLSSATAAGLSGLASAGVGLSGEQLSMLDTMKSQLATLVAAEQARPCHCKDVDANTIRIASLEIQLASMQAAASGIPTCTVASTFGLPAGSDDGVPPFTKKASGGNGAYHCKCVEQLVIRVQALEAARGAAAREGAREPLLPHMRQYPPGIPGAAAVEAIDVNGPIKLILPLGQLGNDRRDKSIYDDKMTSQSEYRYDGGKTGGAAWKSKVERYFITKIPVAMEILKWAESHNLELITEEKFVAAAHPHLSEEQCQTFNREI
jgi:hypothetical protein